MSKSFPPSSSKAGSGMADMLFANAARAFAFFVFVLLVAIMLSLIYGSWDSITTFGFSFLFNTEWNPVENQYGAVVPIIGTLATAGIALIIAVPASFGIALFLTELAPLWIRRPLGIAIEMLAAIPSIIYGMWGLFVFVPLFQKYIQVYLIEFFAPIPVLNQLIAGPPMGIGLFTAGLILSIMIIPYIASVMRDVFSVVPPMFKESAYGLGATTWEVMTKVVLPYTKGGVIGGIMLGLGRALGETMAVAFVIGNAFRTPNSIFAPSNSIASAIANEFNEASGLQLAALIELGLILFLITTVVLSLSRWMLYRLDKKQGSRT